MLQISRLLITYMCAMSGRMLTHYVLIATAMNKRYMLSHANLFLRHATSGSTDTSSRYSNVISMFYRYLSTLEKYQDVPVAQYHLLVDNDDLKNWQIKRNIDRLAKQSIKPSTETIEIDAKVIYGFFYWLNDEGYPSCLNYKLETWQPNFKNEGLLNYIKREAKVVLSSKGIKALDRESRQRRAYSLITNEEIKDLLENFHDPVYPAMFKLALGTAMRPMDLCEFPYAGNGFNRHIQPWDNMTFENATVDYRVDASKGNKTRDIKIHRDDLETLYKHYTKDLYAPRAELYAKKFGKPCPPSILFLNVDGVPVTPKMVSVRSNAAKRRAINAGSKMRESVCFYDSRHWWPTVFLIKRFKSGLLGQLSEVRDAAAMQVLKTQMGHAKLQTTYEHYVDVARVVLLAHEGFVHELYANPDQSVDQFLESPAFG